MSRSCLERLNEPKYWGWVVVIADFLSLFLTVGTMRSLGVFYDEWMDYFEDFSTVTSTLSITTSVVSTFVGLVASTLATRFGERPVVITGGIISSIGFFASAFTPNIYVLFGTFGVLIGIGYSLAYTPLYTLPVYYFKKRPGLVLGIAATGYSIGGMVIPIMLQYLIEAYSWRGAAIVFSALSLNLCVCGAVARPVSDTSTQKGTNAGENDSAVAVAVSEVKDPTQDQNNVESNSAEKISNLSQDGGDCKNIHKNGEMSVNGIASANDIKSNAELEASDETRPAATMDRRAYRLLKAFKDMATNGHFILLNLETILFSAALHIVKAHTKSTVIDVCGVGEIEGTYALTALNGGTLLGSIGTGLLMYRFPNLDTVLVIMMYMTVCGASMILIPFVGSEYYVVLALCVVVGMTVNPHAFVVPITHKHMLGLEHVTLAFGVFLTFMGIGGFIGPALAGYAYDMTGAHTYSLYIAGAFDIGGNILLLPTCMMNLRKRSLSKGKAKEETMGGDLVPEKGHVNPSFVFTTDVDDYPDPVESGKADVEDADALDTHL